MPGFSQSRIAAKLQDIVSARRKEVGLYGEIAEQLPLPETGRLLDVGTGSGLQLQVIYEMMPGLELFGLDLSSAAIQVAHKNLRAIDVDLRVGSIEQTSYPDGFFDVVTCNASMSYWRDPVSCFDEIHRILKPGGTAVLFEPQQDVDIDEVVATIRTNLADEGPLRRWAAATLNRFALRWGHKLGLKLYAVAQVREMVGRSRFGANTSIERVTLQNLPIFMRITLVKLAEGSRPI
jgi:ubiquinone/menaquinone biosynthesis C-methylase UbiE